MFVLCLPDRVSNLPAKHIFTRRKPLDKKNQRF